MNAAVNHRRWPPKIGLLFMGDELDEIWGSAITTLYLAEALRTRGAEVWRASATHTPNWGLVVKEPPDLLIAEGVPTKLIPPLLGGVGITKILWCLSDLFSRDDRLADSYFDGVATNSGIVLERLTREGILAKRIDLAVSSSFAISPTESGFSPECVYLGCYPHKSNQQMDMLFRPAAKYHLSIWGYGWRASPYSEFARGPLPLISIPGLYHSASIVLALTEQRQKRLGMINNRIYEALACGAVVLSDEFPALEFSDIGKAINFVATENEARSFLERFFCDNSFNEECHRRAKLGQQLVLNQHTYDRRADAFLSFYNHLADRRNG